MVGGPHNLNCIKGLQHQEGWETTAVGIPWGMM